jgi:hypothetical protein
MPLMYNGNSRSSDEIPIWDLKTTASHPPEDVQHLPYHTGPQTHNDVERDDRQRVNRRDILPGGKYRGTALLIRCLGFTSLHSVSDLWVPSNCKAFLAL